LIASHFDQTDMVQKLVTAMVTALPDLMREYVSLSAVDRSRAEAIEALITRSFQGLRRLGMLDEIGLFYRRLAESLNASVDPDKGETQSNRLLLRIAAGWYFLGQQEAAREITSKVLLRLTDAASLDPPTARLLCGYLDAVGHAPAEEAIDRVLGAFAMNRGTEPQIANVAPSLTTDSHFSISHLDVVEAAVMSLVNADISLTAETRRWLDEDELFVRNRIHQEMRAAEEGTLA
ncbi:MAG: hypothetical protein P8L85_12750, partial [Rubripirellula sp.]|nr:hypothetical protein [Rubripirellula sp.]